MTDTKHTPTPWHNKYYYIYDENGNDIADSISSKSFGLSEANAAHIVKCVNMHDELVEALKVSNEKLYNLLFDGEDHPLIKANNEALKKAGAL